MRSCCMRDFQRDVRRLHLTATQDFVAHSPCQLCSIHKPACCLRSGGRPHQMRLIIFTTTAVAARRGHASSTKAWPGWLQSLQHQFRLWSSSTAAREEQRPEQHVPVSGVIPTTVAVYTIWGANTGVGKTLASVGLANATRLLQVPLQYLKPVQTGFPADSDARLVATAAGAQLHLGHHAQQLMPTTGSVQGDAADSGRYSSSCKVLHAWSAPVSPHLAVMNEGRPVTDSQLVSSITSELQQFAMQQHQSHLQAATGAQHASYVSTPLALVETAGGVASPAPSGRIMCDTLLPLRSPCVLVGDPRLGGISATISAYESLLLRGYEVDVILFMDPQDTPETAPRVPQQIATQSSDSSSSTVQVQFTAANRSCGAGGLGNADALRQHLSTQIHRLGAPPVLVVAVPGCQPMSDGSSMASEQPSAPGLAVLDSNMKAWLKASAPYFKDLVRLLQQRHEQRQQRLSTSLELAMKHIWWPFTQHASLSCSAVQVVDGRCGAHLVTHQQQEQTADTSTPAVKSSLVPRFDACASWWTQAVAEPHHQSEIARSVAYAAGRYLHVMSPQVVHQVGLDATMGLLNTVGKGWASRVFFSDDGSTAIEVALKMAFRKYMVDHNLTQANSVELKVVGLENAYHGDTLGAMDCVAPSVFNAPSQAPWYRGRGLFLTPSYLGMRQGQWGIVERPEWLASDMASEETWPHLDVVLSETRDSSKLTQAYRQYVDSQLDAHTAAAASKSSPSHLAALIIEPLIQGAGGMKMVDPQFQRELIQACRVRGIPIIVDEVMTGLYRLGSLTASQRMRLQPDIACYAKLMTAGVVPMAATLATEAIFQSFQGDSKLQALLHGHSYTAFPVGCAATVSAIQLLSAPQHNPNVCTPHGSKPTCPTREVCQQPCGQLHNMWDGGRVQRLSSHPLVDHALAVGTVFAAKLKAREGGGYASTSSVDVVTQLRDTHNVYARPLGDVVYLMVPPTITRTKCDQLLDALEQVLNVCSDPSRSSKTDAGDGCVV